MKNHLPLYLGVLLIGCFSLYGQNPAENPTYDSIIHSSWVIGIGMNIVDDSATPFGQDFLKIRETWNFAPYPSRLSIGRFFSNGWGVEAIGSYNRYPEGKKVDGVIIDAPQTYYSLDAKISYDLNTLFGDTRWFDPYLHVGAGYSSIDDLGRMTANGGFGFNTWFNDRWGLNFNTVGKWGIKQGSTKQLQHSAGVVYRFGMEKGLSEKDQEALLMQQKMDKEQQMRKDSMLAVQKAEGEARLLAERLEKEKEAARLATEEKNKTVRYNTLRESLESIGDVYFDFDSSYLNKASKGTLDAVATLMSQYPEFHFEIHAYTDSRGPANYNQWLSERRAQRTVDYLISKGISESRLTGFGHGESKLKNGCVDGVPCSAQQHGENRRSDITAIRIINPLSD
ncbi:OmpA family protein [Muriicola marianensis]|nr:OmpA family protein [Muriicola marianensis]